MPNDPSLTQTASSAMVAQKGRNHGPDVLRGIAARMITRLFTDRGSGRRQGQVQPKSGTEARAQRTPKPPKPPKPAKAPKAPVAPTPSAPKAPGRLISKPQDIHENFPHIGGTPPPPMEIGTLPLTDSSTGSPISPEVAETKERLKPYYDRRDALKHARDMAAAEVENARHMMRISKNPQMAEARYREAIAAHERARRDVIGHRRSGVTALRQAAGNRMRAWGVEE